MDEIIKDPRVLIIILNYNTYNLTLEIIKRLHSIDYNNYDIIVIDNCSPNESGKVLSNYSDRGGYIFIENDKNSGYAAGNNIGLKYAYNHDYDYSWILNNDVIINDDKVLKKLVYSIKKEKDVSVVGPKIVTADDTVCAPFCRRPTTWRLTFGIGLEKKYRKKYIDIPRKVYKVYGCCFLANNKDLNAVNYLDEETFLYCEEDILSERLIRIGKRVFYDPSITVKHNEASSIKTFSKEKEQKMQTIVKHSQDVYFLKYLGYSRLHANYIYKIRNILFGLRKKYAQIIKE